MEFNEKGHKAVVEVAVFNGGGEIVEHAGKRKKKAEEKTQKIKKERPDFLFKELCMIRLTPYLSKPLSLYQDTFQHTWRTRSIFQHAQSEQ